MKIVMTGIDYKKAGIDVRERVAVTGGQAGVALERLKATGWVSGCFILSTCNRTEVYASVRGPEGGSLAMSFCRALNLDFPDYQSFFIEAEGDAAVKRLCVVASGADSQIMGDDQIITQVREAVEFSRENGWMDSFLETAARTAIQTAKAIKTNILLRDDELSSAPFAAVRKLRQTTTLKGKKALVIGNGQMGRLAAELLVREGVNVTVTLREYKTGVIQVPGGVSTVGYSHRYDVMPDMDMVLSATKSPHFTLEHTPFKKLARQPDILIDLAVPRDIDPQIGALPGIALLTVDDLGGGHEQALSSSARLQINAIIDENIAKYKKWVQYKLSLTHHKALAGEVVS